MKKQALVELLVLEKLKITHHIDMYLKKIIILIILPIRSLDFTLLLVLSRAFSLKIEQILKIVSLGNKP